MDSDAMVLVLTTMPVDSDAEELAALLVGERLAACVNVMGPMRSVYRWRREVERADERQLLIKTTADWVAAVEERLAQLHPHEVPEFVVLPVERASRTYLAWLQHSVRLAPSDD